MRALATLSALGLIAGCEPVVIVAQPPAPSVPVTDRASEEAALAAGFAPGEGLPPAGAPACTPPGAATAGIEPPCADGARAG